MGYVSFREGIYSLRLKKLGNGDTHDFRKVMNPRWGDPVNKKQWESDI